MILRNLVSMPNPVPRRVHIAPQGFEDKRIYGPAIRRDADVVILVTHTESDETATACRERIEAELDEAGIDVESITSDIFELNDSIEAILAAIRARHDNDSIEVNISSGSKITAIAGMLTCMFTSAEPYYVVPEGYHEGNGDSDQDTVSHGMDDIKFLPAYPFTEPDYQLIEVLSFIQDEQGNEPPAGVQLNEIGRFLLEENLPAVEGSDKTPDEAEDIYPTVNEKIVNPLRQRNLVTKTRFDGATHIRTTPEASEILELADSLRQW
jgi:hypothetical protein